MRVAISVEGNTEREFVKTVLGEHFHPLGIFVQPVSIDGGRITFEKIASEIKRLLSSDFALVTTLYDFYGFKDRKGRSIEQLEKELRDIPVAYPKIFLPYIQQYEFEALLFSDPIAIANEFSQLNKVEELENIVRKCGEPEKINDGYDTCPSRRLLGMFSNYNKTLHGPSICKQIGLLKIRVKCPRFNRWITEIEDFGVATQALSV